MRDILLWWTRKTKEEKKSIMNTHNIEVITYDFIKTLYLESL